MSQGAVIIPGSPLSGASLCGDISSGLAAVISKFSGSSAPTLGPGASSALVAGQEWLNTAAALNVLSIHDGTSFVPWAMLDTVAHLILIPGPNRNVLGDNGGMEVWQRGAGSSSSFAVPASTTQYTADRWYIATGTNQASVVAAATGLTNTSQLAAKVSRNNGQTGTGAYTFGFPLDTDEVFRLRSKKVALSAVVKSGANWSPASGTITCTLYVGTGAVAKRGGGFTSETNVVSGSASLSVSTQGTISAIASATLPTNATQGEVQFTWTPVGTAGADDSIQIDDVQCEDSGFVSSFERVPFERALLGCKRHFWKTFPYGTAPAQATNPAAILHAIVGKLGANPVFMSTRNPVTMRATPTATGYNPLASNGQVRSIGTNDCSSTSISATTEDIFITATGNAGAAVGDDLQISLSVDGGI